jgi:pilus assembly protein CpaE
VSAVTAYLETDPGRPHPGPAASPSIMDSRAALAAELRRTPGVTVVVVGAGVLLDDALAVAAEYRVSRPALGVVLLRDEIHVDVLTEAIRAGVREVVPAGDPAALAAACARSRAVSAQLDGVTTEPARQATVVTVFAGKGGCGKSVVSTNLAVTLAAGGRNRVLLVDLDLQFGDVAILLQVPPEHSIASAIPMAGRLDEAGVRGLLTAYRPGLDVLLAPAGPAEGDHVTRELVGELLTVARTMFDFIVVDTPPYFTDQVLAALDRTDWYVLVMTPDLPTLKSVRLTQDMFQLLEYPTARRLTLLNRADSKVGLSVSDVEKAVGTPMSVLMPSSRDVPLSVNQGVPLAVGDPAHPVSRAVLELAHRCAGGRLAAADERHSAGALERLRRFGRRS